MDESQMIDRDQLKEGALYAYKDGVLTEIQTDPDDTMKRIKILEGAYQSAVIVQRNMRKLLNGYRPDLHLICSALIELGASQPQAEQAVKAFCTHLFEECGDGC